MLRLSFIVPFYNVEPYIEECIRSLYAQDIPWDEYEVICVDDCSPDGSRAIVERLQKEYPTLQLLTTPENLRQGGARNMALDVAKGKYICFVDSDDYLKANSIKRLLELSEEQDLEILDFDFDSGDIGLRMGMSKNPVSYTMGVCTGTDYVFDSRSLWANKCCCVCAMLISRKFIEDNNLRFVEKMQYEDTDFSIEMFAKAVRIIHLGEKVYYYRYNPESTTHAVISKANIFYRVQAIKRFRILYDKIVHPLWKNAIVEIIKNDVYDLLTILHNTSLKNQYYFYSNRLGRIKEIEILIGKKSKLALKFWLMLIIIKR